MKAQIKEKREIAKGTLLATFDLLGEEVDFVPRSRRGGDAPFSCRLRCLRRGP
jgi:hypothetical protein